MKVRLAGAAKGMVYFKRRTAGNNIMKRHIIVTEYNTAWPALFETETEKIQTILGETLVAVHHIGSTSVKGMKAKPTIDIMPVAHEIGTADPHKREFEAIGYEYLGEYGIPGRRYLRKVWGEDDLYHIHIFEESNREDIVRHLAVRDYLRTHTAAANAYGELKAALAGAFPYDNDGYCDGKDAFVKRLEQDALAWYMEKGDF